MKECFYNHKIIKPIVESSLSYHLNEAASVGVAVFVLSAYATNKCYENRETSIPQCVKFLDKFKLSFCKDKSCWAQDYSPLIIKRNLRYSPLFKRESERISEYELDRFSEVEKDFFDLIKHHMSKIVDGMIAQFKKETSISYDDDAGKTLWYFDKGFYFSVLQKFIKENNLLNEKDVFNPKDLTQMQARAFLERFPFMEADVKTGFMKKLFDKSRKDDDLSMVF